jgi:trigger factor
MAIKKLPKSKVEISISILWEDWKKYINQSVAEISEEIKIDGFRPGKAPRNLIEQKVGKGTILNKAGQKAVEKSYIDFVVKEKLEVIGQPKIEIESIDEEKNLDFKVEVAVMPKVEVNPKYKAGIKKINEEEAKKKIEIKDEELQLELERLANSRVKLITVLREARNNDSVEVDFEVSIGGAPIEGGTSQNHPLVIGKGVFIPGFEEKIIGMKAGEEKEFELAFPEDYHKKDLAGKPATFKVKMNLVQERQTPEINDDFAVSLGKFENLEALKKNMREGMEHEQKHKNAEEKRGKYVEEIINETKVEIPEILIDEESHKMLHEFEHQVQSMGLTIDKYLEQLGKKKEDLLKDWAPQAERRVLSALGLRQLIEDLEIKAESKEVEEEMNKTLQYYKNVKDFEKNVDMKALYSYTKGVVENEKVFEILSKL